MKCSLIFVFSCSQIRRYRWMPDQRELHAPCGDRTIYMICILAGWKHMKSLSHCIIIILTFSFCPHQMQNIGSLSLCKQALDSWNHTAVVIIGSTRWKIYFQNLNPVMSFMSLIFTISVKQRDIPFLNSASDDAPQCGLFLQYVDSLRNIFNISFVHSLFAFMRVPISSRTWVWLVCWVGLPIYPASG